MESKDVKKFGRIDFKEEVPAAYQVMLGLEAHVHQSGLEPSLVELIRMRASQINGCAYQPAARSAK